MMMGKVLALFPNIAEIYFVQPLFVKDLQKFYSYDSWLKLRLKVVCVDYYPGNHFNSNCFAGNQKVGVYRVPRFITLSPHPLR